MKMERKFRYMMAKPMTRLMKMTNRVVAPIVQVNPGIPVTRMRLMTRADQCLHVCTWKLYCMQRFTHL